MKRFFDIAASLFGLIALGWLIGLLAILIRRESDGPGIFRQERVGRHGRTFICYKMRTMARETPNAASHETSASFVTPLGARLRRYKLDELPQLWNVLRGEMSLVGPRPCLPVQTQLIAARMAEGAFAVRPGITGPAQVRGIDMSEPERLARIDGAYARERSFFADLRLIFQTLAGGGQGDRVKLEAGPPKTDSALPDPSNTREPAGRAERMP
ncbi:Sugar transferase involved in LPS biosynthesis (colanic, teichoic acid) [Fulvimarina manganoxydans]|uniref:Sugar transferase involved in LPS biosynthesis (Colanic, teichoic acid) n=1 Tax=Fulvimarina manganoxydans TaxID=937218 RepID=A0A1W1ZNU7_9HYPH|nr:sugar transferase [Fulvimarina manganoxydans]SMC50109.1 Sugar transferase involved in LPS biosynthesis (colanic, teichoic acid) [Fulvimarina manganoxydans]